MRTFEILSLDCDPSVFGYGWELNASYRTGINFQASNLEAALPIARKLLRDERNESHLRVYTDTDPWGCDDERIYLGRGYVKYRGVKPRYCIQEKEATKSKVFA